MLAKQISGAGDTGRNLSMEEIKCIFCNKSSEDVVIEENGFKGRKCPECGLIFISPRPTQAEILDIYARNITYARSHRSNDYAGRLTTRTTIQARLYETNLIMTNQSNPFPTSLSAAFIKNCNKNIPISDAIENKNGAK